MTAPLKLTNPLHYPLAILLGGLALILGTRLGQWPPYLTFPLAGAIAWGAAVPFQKQSHNQIKLDNPALTKELKSARQQAKSLTEKAEELRLEAQKLLTSSTQLDLLAAVEFTCAQVQELPSKVDQLGRQLEGSDSLLSPQELTAQLQEVRAKAQNSAGVAQKQLNHLADSLANNLQLAQQGQDARQAQVISVAMIVSESAGILQQFQNQLRTSNLDNSGEIEELKTLTGELKNMQDNINLLIS